MNKVELEETQVVDNLECKYKVSYQFDGKIDYTLLEFLPVIMAELTKGDDYEG
jgi:hypothetical protein